MQKVFGRTIGGLYRMSVILTHWDLWCPQKHAFARWKCGQAAVPAVCLLYGMVRGSALCKGVQFGLREYPVTVAKSGPRDFYRQLPTCGTAGPGRSPPPSPLPTAQNKICTTRYTRRNAAASKGIWCAQDGCSRSRQNFSTLGIAGGALLILGGGDGGGDGSK